MKHLARALVPILILGLFLSSCDSAPSENAVSPTGPALSSTPDSGPDDLTAFARHGDAAPSELFQQLATVRRLTVKYRDVAVAREDGWFAVSPYIPGMGFHFASSLPPFGTDLEAPGVLVYVPNGRYRPEPFQEHDPRRDGDLILAAVEWLVPGDQTAAPPDIFADGASPVPLPVSEAEGWHFEEAEGFSGLHAWVHRANPEGVFHTTNPTVR